MGEFFRKIFDTSDFPPRWNCGNWDSFHGWLHILSDVAIWGAYSAIPFALTWYWWKKRDELAFPRLLWLFGAFIFSCGTTHLIEAVIFYHPIYRVSGMMKFVTAAVSWATVIAIIRVAPRAMELPGMVRMNAELQRQLARTREAEAALARSNRDLEAFTGIVSHDLRNPVNGALFMAELALESTAAGNPEAAGKQISQVIDELRKMETSVKELHSQSKVGRKRDGWPPVDLTEVLASVRKTLEPTLNQTGTRVIMGALPVVEANRAMLEHLFTNLLDNAVKYRSANSPVIEVRSESVDGSILVTVSDNGRGIPNAELGRIFDSEYRATNVRNESGSGLGLALCRKVMEDCGGTIQARAGEKGGSVFVLRFPQPAVAP